MNQNAIELLDRFENTLRAMGYSDRQIEVITAPTKALYDELKADLASLLCRTQSERSSLT